MTYRDLSEAERVASDHSELVLAIAEQWARLKATRGDPLSTAEQRTLRLTWGPLWESLLVPGVEPKPPTKADQVRAWKAANREKLREQQRRYRARKAVPEPSS